MSFTSSSANTPPLKNSLPTYPIFSSSGKINTTTQQASPPTTAPIASITSSVDEENRTITDTGGTPTNSASDDALPIKDEEDTTGGFPVPTWPSEEDLSMSLVDLLLASAAAPTFFPAHKGPFF